MDRQNSEPVLFAYSPYLMYLFKKALRKGKEKDRRIRVNIVGNYGQGKTCLAKRLAGLKCKGVETTNGIEINLYKCKSITEKRSMERIEDERQYFSSRMASVARSISTANDIPSLPEASSDAYIPENVSTSHKKVSYTSRGTKLRRLFKTFKSKLRGSTKRNQELATNIRPQVENTIIVKSSTNVSELKSFEDEIKAGEKEAHAVLEFWDFGGQFIFYATHSLFHSRKAIYLLVFDLSVPLDTPVKNEDFLCKTDEKNMEYYARFWIESIHYFVGQGPPVILVGTHKDKLHGDEDTKDAAKNKYFENVKRLFDDDDETGLINHIQEEDFAVSNFDSSDADIDNILKVILQKGIDLMETSDIPARWIPLEKRLYEEKHRKIVTFERIREINKEMECQLADDEELKLFLLYHHEKGSLIFFDEESVSEKVVLDPQFLIDAFNCIITPTASLPKIQSLRKECNSLIKQGKLETSLIDHVWSGDFKKHQPDLLAFLQKHYIISQVEEYHEGSGKRMKNEWYIVPSLLKDYSPDNKMLCEFLSGKSQTKIRFVMQFKNPRIILIVYHRLLAASLGKWPVVNLGKTQILFRNLCVLHLKNYHAGLMEMKSSSIELQVSNSCEKPVKREVSDSFRRFAELIIMQEYKKLKHEVDSKSEPYTRLYRCNHSEHGLEGSQCTRAIKELSNADINLCPDNKYHQGHNNRRALTEWFLEKLDHTEFPKIALSERHLSKLASAISYNWELLAPFLGETITQTCIDHIRADNHTEPMRIFSMLQKWRIDSADSATFDVLGNALNTCSKVEVDWNVVNNLKEELSRTSKAAELKLAENKPHDSLEVLDEQKPPKFIRSLTNQRVESTHCTVVFECELSKYVPVQWYHNSKVIEHSGKYDMSDEGTIHKLEIRDINSTDEGKYCVIAEGQKSSAELVLEETEEEKELRRCAENKQMITVANPSQRNNAEDGCASNRTPEGHKRNRASGQRIILPPPSYHESTVYTVVDIHQPNGRHTDRRLSTLSAPLSEPKDVPTPNLSSGTRKSTAPIIVHKTTQIYHGPVITSKGGNTQIVFGGASPKSKNRNVEITYNRKDVKEGEDQSLLEGEVTETEFNRENSKSLPSFEDSNKQNVPEADSVGKLRTKTLLGKETLGKSKSASFRRTISLSQDSVFSPQTIQDVESLFNDSDEYKKLISKVIDKCMRYLVDNMDPKSMLDVFPEKEMFEYTFRRDISDIQIQTERSRKILTEIRTTGKQYYQDFKYCLRDTKQYSCLAKVEKVQSDVLAKMGINY